MSPSSLFWRYTAFQVPGWVLAAGGGVLIYHWFDVPHWLAFGVLVVWVVKDYALYPLFKGAYELDHRQPIERLVGQAGSTVEPLSPTGYVRVRGELWRARTNQPDGIDVGHPVEVTGIDGTILLVASQDLPQLPALGDDSETMAVERQPSSVSWPESR